MDLGRILEAFWEPKWTENRLKTMLEEWWQKDDDKDDQKWVNIANWSRKSERDMVGTRTGAAIWARAADPLEPFLEGFDKLKLIDFDMRFIHARPLAMRGRRISKTPCGRIPPPPSLRDLLEERSRRKFLKKTSESFKILSRSCTRIPWKITKKD